MQVKNKKKFWFYVDKVSSKHLYKGTRCWEWTGSKNYDGYGEFHAKLRTGKYYTIRAHRIAWLFKYKTLKKKIYVLHHCDNRACVNTKHLFLGTQQDNMDDMYAKGRQRHNGAKGSKNNLSKLTEADVKQIRRRYKPYKNGQALADEFGIHREHLYLIIKRECWRHI